MAFKAFSAVRYLFIVALFVGAMTSIAAARVDPASNTRAAHPNRDNPGELFAACVESRDADSDYCLRALEVSGLDADFFARLAANREAQLSEEKPREEKKREEKKHNDELWTLVKECAATGDLESEECVRAIEASGLSLEDFNAKFAAKLGCIAVRNWDEEDPCAKHDQEKTYSSTMKDCLSLRASINGRSADELMGIAEKVNVVCGKALKESRLSASQFWSKYR